MPGRGAVVLHEVVVFHAEPLDEEPGEAAGLGGERGERLGRHLVEELVVLLGEDEHVPLARGKGVEDGERAPGLAHARGRDFTADDAAEEAGFAHGGIL